MNPIKRISCHILGIFAKHTKLILIIVLAIFASMIIALAAGKIYQHWDNDPDRGAIPMDVLSMGESYSTPVYVDQGWSQADSLWFYNTTQGSNLLPYDLFIALEQADSQELFRSSKNIDYYRYLPQKPTFFNPDGLPVGFVLDNYDGKDYVGFTCAACHTGQVNFKGKAIRIDGGPAMADMDGFLKALEKALQATLDDNAKKERLISAVMDRNGLGKILSGGRSYSSAQEVQADLELWANRIKVYNSLNKSSVEYGYARLDAFGRIYNRVLEHVMDKSQVANKLAFVFYPNGTEQGQRVLTRDEINNVLNGLDDLILGQSGFETILARLQSKQPGYPGLDEFEIGLVKSALFNEANAPVSYPFLWDIAQSDYVQWNGLAANEGLGPLGRNTGEVIGVFATLDWHEDKPQWWQFWKWGRDFSLSAFASGQSNKREHIDFQSSINKTNLSRMESHLRHLESPRWEDVQFADGTRLPAIDNSLVARGEELYSRYCASCHEVINTKAWDRRVVSNMMNTKKIGTDPTMADNSVNYTGPSGNFQHIYQSTTVGNVLVQAEAPVVQVLTAATRGVIATPDHDKWAVRRWLDWMYTVASSLFDNDIKASVKAGDYIPDTTNNPYASLQSYKARPLNGIWATAPYLHNGSVPTLYDLLLPKKRPGDPDDGEYRPDQFRVGCRELDTNKVGVICEADNGTLFDVREKGNANTGHEYAAGITPPAGAEKPLPGMNKEDRKALVEYLKTL